MRPKHAITGVMLATLAASAVITAAANPALASRNDSFSVKTSNHCGTLSFVDYGPGAPGNGKANDDYLVVHDYCADGLGVRAWAFVRPRGFSGYTSLGSKYNGNGRSGAPVYWDPFQALDASHNLLGGDTIAIRVCLVNGSKGAPRPGCSKLTYHTMHDG